MDQKKLYKTVETIANQKFNTEHEMLTTILNHLISFEDVQVSGGRLWQIDAEKGVYILVYQTGNVDTISPDFVLPIKEYPIFDFIAKERTILDTETNLILRSKGILKYSATGIGDKLKVGKNSYYEYLLALNTLNISEEQRITLNIIATAVTSQIKQKRYSKRAKMLKANLDEARELQKSILPEHEYHFHNYDLFGITDPAEIVGGDFFDYLQIGDDEDRLGITVGDAASKGVAASAEAMYIAGALRMAAGFEIKIYPLMKRMNQLVNKIFADDKFASLFYGEISNDESGLFLYSNGGHNPPFFVKAESNEVIFLKTTGPVLGPAPQAKYGVENINFSINDVLIIYSDGVTESADADFQPYGEERLISVVQKNKHLTPKEITYMILDDVIKFSKNGQYTDDKTLVVIKRVK